jgi:hypothetical protein
MREDFDPISRARRCERCEKIFIDIDPLELTASRKRHMKKAHPDDKDLDSQPLSSLNRA